MHKVGGGGVRFIFQKFFFEPPEPDGLGCRV